MMKNKEIHMEQNDFVKDIIKNKEYQEANIVGKTVMISINKSYKLASIYDATRLSWKEKLTKISEAELVLSTVNGFIVGAFIPDNWFEVEAEKGTRVGFEGKEAPAFIINQYVGKRVPQEFRKKGHARPVKYSWNTAPTDKKELSNTKGSEHALKLAMIMNCEEVFMEKYLDDALKSSGYTEDEFDDCETISEEVNITAKFNMMEEFIISECKGKVASSIVDNGKVNMYLNHDDSMFQINDVDDLGEISHEYWSDLDPEFTEIYIELSPLPNEQFLSEGNQLDEGLIKLSQLIEPFTITIKSESGELIEQEYDNGSHGKGFINGNDKEMNGNSSLLISNSGFFN
jgi:hypothetical protein